MRVKKVWIIIGAAILLLIISTLTFFFVRSLVKVAVINNNPDFAVVYQDTPLFSQHLDEWGIFREEFMIGDQQGQIKRMRVVFTEAPQEKYTLFLSPDNPPIQSYDWSFSPDGTYEILVYLSPEYHKQLSQRHRDLSVTSAIVRILFYLSHPDKIAAGDYPPELLEVFDEYKDEAELPFLAALK